MCRLHSLLLLCRLLHTCKMASLQQKIKCVQWFVKLKSPTLVQRQFRRLYKKAAPTRVTIRRWLKQFEDTGSVLHKKGAGRPRTSVIDVERVRTAFLRSPQKSVRQASRELQLPPATVHKVMHKRLGLHAYKIQMVQELKPHDGPLRKAFAIDMLERIENDQNFLKNVVFSDEATFHISGKVNRHNCRIWGSENPHVIREHQRDSEKVNVWCALYHNTVIGPFFFAEKTITGITYLDMLEQFALPQLSNLQPGIVFQQDGAPPHWNLNVRAFLDTTFPGRWIGRGGPIAWPPRSPDVTPLDFFMWGYVKNIVYETKVQDVETMRARITSAVAMITPEMLARTWLEIEKRLHILRATNGSHVEVY
jgi:hypothetical protein